MSRFQVGGWSQQGFRRTANADAWMAYVPEDPVHLGRKGGLFAIAEGFLPDGNDAPWLGAIVLDLLGQHYYADPSPDLSGGLVRAVHAVNRSLCEWRRAKGQRAVATLLALAVTPRSVAVAQVGDAGAYLVRHGAVGALTPRTTRQAGGARTISAALGWAPVLAVGMGETAPLPGDALVLCSGGVTATWPAPLVGQAVTRLLPAHAAAELVQSSWDDDGRANRTVVVVRIPDPALAAAVGGAALEYQPRVTGYDGDDWRPTVEALGAIGLAGGLIALLMALAAK